jgi:large-conductance mechanosensitive channel
MLDTKDIIILTVSFYLGGVTANFFKSLSEDIITPLLASTDSASENLKTWTVTVGKAKLKVGEFLAAFVNLVFSFAVTVFVVGLLRTYVLSRIGATRQS